MKTFELLPTTELNDAELVTESMDGNPDAFRQIVQRYQTLISSLAYCATGNVSQSEDLAQETFVVAWKELATLREPAKLRPWLCSIARFRSSKAIRQARHEPVYAAESLDAADEWASSEPLPPDQVISEEEKAILWRSLERIPEIYREPLVLFYREHQSVETVAQDLGLTEDAVKQRLSRGRKLLQEQFLAFVAGALKQTTPGKTFTLGVMAVLPFMTTTAKAATASATAAKGGAMAKATGLGAFFQAIIHTASGLLGVLSSVLLLGGHFGFKMGGDARQSTQQREKVVIFWRIMVGCLVVLVLAPILLVVFLGHIGVDAETRRRGFLAVLTIWLGLTYAVVAAALFLWARQRRQHVESRVTNESETATGTGKKKWFKQWVAMAMIGTACLLGLLCLDTHWKVQRITLAEAQKMVAAGKVSQTAFSISQYQNGTSNIWIVRQENGKKTTYCGPVDAATVAMIKAQGLECPTHVQGRDFEVLGWPGRFLGLLCIFILAIGGANLMRKSREFNRQEVDAQQKGAGNI